MRTHKNIFVRLMAIVMALSGFAWNQSFSPALAHAGSQLNLARPSTLNDVGRQKLSAAYGRLPLSFEANRGQADSRVKFLSRGGGYTLFLTSDEAVLVLSKPGAGESIKDSLTESDHQITHAGASRQSVIRMKLAGASAPSAVSGMDELPGKSNYFIGKESKNWLANVSNYSVVKYQGVYAGVDMVFYGNQRQLEYDLHLAPGADSRAIAIDFEGAQTVRIDKSGDLILSTADGELRQLQPVVYQEVKGVKKIIPAHYVMRGSRRVGFAIARYDRRKPLVIDPILAYSTYLGGSSFDTGKAIAVDASGNAYVTGSTRSSNFPTTGSPKPFEDFSSDAFVTKLNPRGTAILYSAYIRSAQDSRSRFGEEQGLAIGVDSAGSAYVTGETDSTEFPTTPGAFQTVRGGDPFEPFRMASL